MRKKLWGILAGLAFVNLVLLILYFVLKPSQRDHRFKKISARLTPPRRLYRLTGEMVLPGVRQIKNIENGDDRNRFEVSGFLVEPPVVKKHGVYLTLALAYSKQAGYTQKVPVFLGKLDEDIGVNIASGGRESPLYTAQKVKDIFPRLKPYRQVLLEITTEISESVLQNPRCQAKPACPQRVREINAYGKKVEPYLLDLIQGKFYPAPTPLGVVAEIVFVD